jgi:arabinan endo-1,5-alpha-L-arabinosidase
VSDTTAHPTEHDGASADDVPATPRRAGRGRILALVAVAVVGVAAVAIVLASTGERSMFTNPVFEPILADPSILWTDDGWFYAYGTEDDWGDGQGSRVVPIVRSRDLVAWEYVGEAFEGRPRWKAGFVWAPDIVAFGDRLHQYYAVSVWGDANPGIGVATADRPEGPFEDHGMLFDSETIGVGNSIDPQLVVDDAGVPYLVWGSFHGIYIVELTDDGLGVAGEPIHLAGDDFEAPYIVERDGAYWMFLSLGSCCDGADSTYRVAGGRSDDLLGPYVDRDGRDLRHSSGTLILLAGDWFVGPGHNAIVTDDTGEDWILYHAIERERPRADSGATRRPMLIDRIVWQDGWPTVEDGVPGEGSRRGPVIDDS